MNTAATDRIPQAAPLAAYLENRDEIDAAMKRVMASGTYILGREVSGFEGEFAAYQSAAGCVAVASGTDALELALRACNVGMGDHVVTVSLTAVATVAAIRRCGGIPALVDVDPATYTMDPDSLALCIKRLVQANKNVRAIIPVHLYGCPADMASVLVIAKQYAISVVEDCAQAHGAMFRGSKIGSLADFGAFSFYPTKNLCAFGDGGAIVTGCLEHVEALKALRQYGWKQRYISETEGVNSRLDELQAAILRAQLPALDKYNEARRAVAHTYTERLAATGVVLPVEPEACSHVYHQYVIRVPRRDAFIRAMSERGIATAIHYPLAAHQQAPYRCYGSVVPLDNTDQIVREIVSLPMFPQLHASQVERVCAAASEVLRQL